MTDHPFRTAGWGPAELPRAKKLLAEFRAEREQEGRDADAEERERSERPIVWDPEQPPDLHQIRALTGGVSLLHVLRTNALDRDLTWVLPPDVLPGVSQLHGLPVVHAAVPGPLLAHWVRPS